MLVINKSYSKVKIIGLGATLFFMGMVGAIATLNTFSDAIYRSTPEPASAPATSKNSVPKDATDKEVDVPARNTSTTDAAARPISAPQPSDQQSTSENQPSQTTSNIEKATPTTPDTTPSSPTTPTTPTEPTPTEPTDPTNPESPTPPTDQPTNPATPSS